MRSLYYAFNAFVALSSVVGWRVFKRNVDFSLVRFLPVLLCVSLPFVLWDVWAANEGHWGFSDTYIIGPFIAGIPIEEILFFVTVPLAMCIVWEAVAGKVSAVRFAYDDKALWAILSVVGVTLLVLHWDKGYTRSALLAFLFTHTLLQVLGYYRSKRFVVFSLLHLFVFFISNTLLTSLPVITYGVGSFIGFRAGTIPIEDFFFSFTLVNAAVVAYDHTRN